jgi:predicted nucleotidyltransferase component of viral defense system
VKDHPRRNVAASVRQRLMNLSRQSGEDFQFVLTKFELERLLYRLAQTSHAEQFVLKGAALFQLWTGLPHRATRDIDLLGFGSPSPDRLRQVFEDVCHLDVEDDGVTFLCDGIQTEEIKKGDEYQGIRIRIDARLGTARIPLQVDVGFGDAITPGPLDATYPTLLEFPPPQVKVYPRETVVAEKFQAMVTLGIANSRMKDFYDVWTLACQFDFDGLPLSAAIQATFARRMTALPKTTPLALTTEFSTDHSKVLQWNAFLRKGRLVESPPPFHDIVALLDSFLMPPTQALASNTNWQRTWASQTWS